MSFNKKVEQYYKVILELDQSVAPPPAQSAVPQAPDVGGGMAADPGMGGGMGGMDPMGGQEDPEQQKLENKTKRDTDPKEYTRSILSLLVDKEEGITPEMFDDFIDSISLGIAKVKDKEGLARFYAEFHKRLTNVLDLQQELKSMFKQMTGVVDDLVGAESEPNEGGGGVGMGGPSGPGV